MTEQGDLISREAAVQAIREDSLCQANCGHTHKASYMNHIANLLATFPAAPQVDAKHERLKDAVVAAAVARHQYYEARAGQEPSVELADAEYKAVRDLLRFEKEQK